MICIDCIHNCVLYTINKVSDIDNKIKRNSMKIPEHLHKNHTISFIKYRYLSAKKYNKCYGFEGLT